MNTLVIERCANGFIVRPDRSEMNGIRLSEVNVFENIEKCFKFIRENMDFKEQLKVKAGAK